MKAKDLIGKKINFEVEYGDIKYNDVFIPYYVNESENSVPILYDKDKDRWCTLDYAIKNLIK
tara:strand:- start:90 stop:275 length:186 start_codon:yes stop_codon:yes gene_type:complete